MKNIIKKINWNFVVFISPLCLLLLLIAILMPIEITIYIGLVIALYFLLFNDKLWSMVVVICLLNVSCVRDHYWSAYSTTHGTAAQERYIKNMKRHREHKRFQTSTSPTFGAQDISKKSGRKNQK